MKNWYNTSEWKLASQLYANLQSEDVVVADSAYGTYGDLALVLASGADAVFRKHHARRCDFRVRQEVGHWGPSGAVATSAAVSAIDES